MGFFKKGLGEGGGEKISRRRVRKEGGGDIDDRFGYRIRPREVSMIRVYPGRGLSPLAREMTTIAGPWLLI